MVKVIGELIEGTAGRAGLKNVREVGERLTKPDRGSSGGRAGEGAEKLLDARGSDLLELGQAIITGMKKTTGQGEPDTGELFGQAQSRFDGVNEALKSADPIGWDGPGSQAYADQNTRQRLRSEAMADADHQVHKVLYREAAQITLRRGYLDDQHNFLANTSYATFPLQFIPRYGEAMKMAIEIRALMITLGESYSQMIQLQSEVAQNAAELQQAAGRYSSVGDGAEMPGATLNFDPPPPPPAGGVRGAPPSERSRQVVATSAAARLSDVSGCIDSAHEAVSAPTRSEEKATQPTPQSMVAGLPPVPQVPPLGSLLSPVGGQAAATPAQRHIKKAGLRDGDRADDKGKHKGKTDDGDPARSASGGGESERPPLPAVPNPTPAALQGTVAAKLVSDDPPGPSAGTPPARS